MITNYQIDARINGTTIPLSDGGFKYSQGLGLDPKIFDCLKNAKQAYKNINKKFLIEDGFDCYQVEILLIEHKHCPNKDGDMERTSNIINRKTIKI